MSAVRVRGGASAEEIAAVVAALHRVALGGAAPESGYARWRRQRLAALRSSRSNALYRPGAGTRSVNRRASG
jgi:hypothetical protein